MSAPRPMVWKFSWAVSTGTLACGAVATKTATVPAPTSACSWSPTAWAATSPARSRRVLPSTRSRPSSPKPPAPTRTARGRFRSNPRSAWTRNRLKAAFRLANRQIANAMADSAICAAWRRPRRRCSRPRSACVAHVGDSRVYVLRDGTLDQLTDDHSWVEEQVRAGTMTPSRRGSIRGATSSRARSRAATIPRSMSTEFDAAPGERFLLCSDGLSRVVPHEQHRADARQPACPRGRSASELIEAANEAGGPDNITVARPRRSMCHNLAQLLALPGPDPEPGRARAEGALSRVGARVLLVVHQPAAAPARSTRSCSSTSCRRARQGHRAVRRCSCSAASCRGPGSPSSLIESSGVADLRRQSDQEGAVSGGDPADRDRAGEHGALLPGAADPGRVPDRATRRR